MIFHLECLHSLLVTGFFWRQNSMMPTMKNSLRVLWVALVAAGGIVLLGFGLGGGVRSRKPDIDDISNRDIQLHDPGDSEHILSSRTAIEIIKARQSAGYLDVLDCPRGFVESVTERDFSCLGEERLEVENFEQGFSPARPSGLSFAPRSS